MPELWLNYGTTEVVLAIEVENLEQTIDTGRIANYGTQGGSNSGGVDAAPGDNTPDSSGGEGASDDGTGDNRSGARNNGSGSSAGTDGAAGDAVATSPDGGAANTGDDTGTRTAGGTAPALGPSQRASQPMDSLGHLKPQDISERLGALDISNPFDMVIMHDSQAVRQVVSSLFLLCEQRAAPFPGVLADRDVLSSVRAGLPEGGVASAFEARSIPLAGDAVKRRTGDGSAAAGGGAPDPGAAADPTSVPRTSDDARGLVFVAETEFDGLFGYETVSTRLIRKFGGTTGSMLSAYAKREGNAPAPGRQTGSFAEAKKFADRFEVRAIDIVAGTGGINGMFVGHPSETAASSSSLMESHRILDVDHQKTMIVSTGSPSSSATLGDALSSAWNCHAAVRKNGLLVLVAECTRGLGPDALRMYVEGRLPHEGLSNPSAYVDGMEELLFLHEVKKKCQIALVSILPEMYTGKLGVIPIEGMLQTMQYMQRTMGARQKASVVMDGSRLLLR